LRTPLFRFSAFRFLSLVTFALALFLFPQNAYSVDVTLAWSENSEEDLDGYRVFCRQEGQSYDYSDPEWEGSETTCIIYNLNDNTTYYFVTRAFDTSGNESGNSNEACYQPNVDVLGVILDTGDAGTSYTGTWGVSGGADPYGDSSLYSNQADATYTFEAYIDGPHEVSLWWTYYSNRCTSVPVEIYDGYTLLDTIYVNQQSDDGQWNVLGTYDFSGTASVVIISEGGCTTCADAVRFAPGSEGGIIESGDEGASDEVILDNSDAAASSTGTWQVSSGANPYSDKSLYSNQADATYTFEAYVDGPHEVSLWWTYYSNRCTSVPVEIYDGYTLLDTIYVNQQSDDGQWNVLGTYDFSGTASVVIISEGGCTTCADAVRFVPDTDFVVDTDFVASPEGIIDNGSAGTSCTGTWQVSGGPDPYSDKSLYSNQAGATYTFEAYIDGPFEVSLWWTYYSNRCTSVPVEIYDGYTLLDTVYVNQQANGGQWNVLGTYDFSGTASVVIISEGSCTTCADAVRFVPGSEGVIIENSDAGTSSTGTWSVSGGANPYSDKSLYSNQADATYTFEAAVDGPYEVSLWWTYYSNRCTSVPVEIYDGTILLDTVYVNQQSDDGQWNVLGTYDFSGTASVVIISEGSCTTCADAVRWHY